MNEFIKSQKKMSKLKSIRGEKEVRLLEVEGKSNKKFTIVFLMCDDLLLNGYYLNPYILGSHKKSMKSSVNGKRTNDESDAGSTARHTKDNFNNLQKISEVDAETENKSITGKPKSSLVKQTTSKSSRKSKKSMLITNSTEDSSKFRTNK